MQDVPEQEVRFNYFTYHKPLRLHGSYTFEKASKGNIPRKNRIYTEVHRSTPNKYVSAEVASIVLS